MRVHSSELLNRVHCQADDWKMQIEETNETETSILAFGHREDQPVVLKLIKQPGDEWHSGEVLQAFDGHGFVRVYEHVPGAILIEHLQPGTSLVQTALSDEEQTEILAEVIEKMAPREPPANCATVEDWGRGFERFLSTGGEQIPKPLITLAQRLFTDLAASQVQRRLLHGDLHHYNVLLDAKRGWLAIDPKGVIGELEYEVGAILRNPFEKPELILSPTSIERRVDQLTTRLHLDRERTLAWAFAQAVLSAIWLIEDGYEVDDSNNSLRLANAIQSML